MDLSWHRGRKREEELLERCIMSFFVMGIVGCCVAQGVLTGPRAIGKLGREFCLETKLS
jgi:hypothetical protein